MLEETFGRAATKEAIVLDTPFNGGSNLVEATSTRPSKREDAISSSRKLWK